MTIDNYQFIKGDIADRKTIDLLFETYKPDIVVNLAAQAGVRYSITNPDAYIQSNLIGFYNILEAHKQLVPMQPGDVPTTYADATALERDYGFTPKITLREGLRHFAEWYKEFYG